MKTPIEKVKLSFKCPVAQEKLIDCGVNKFCTVCNKKLIDFRGKDYTKLIHTIDHETCGIFSTKRTQNISYNPSFKKVFATVLITLGLSPMGEKLLAQKDTSRTNRFYEEVEEEVFLGTIVETMPVFKFGGEAGLTNFLKENLKYPADSPEGKAFVKFTIDTTGKVINPEIIKSVSKLADVEVLRVVKLLEFIPGTQRGKKVEVIYHLPVHFSRNSIKTKKGK